MLGALSVLQQQEWLNHVTTFYGCSVGSIIATGMCLGIPCSTLKKRVAKHPILFNTPPEHLLRNSAKFGLHDPQCLSQFIKKVTRVGKRTFQELFQQTQKHLIVVVCNVSTGHIEHWDYRSHPDTKVSVALKLSCHIPFVFTHGRHQGHLYVDGGVGEPIPHTSNAMSTLAISFHDRIDEPIESIVDYTRSMIRAATKMQPVRWHLRLEAGDLSPFQFDMDPDTVQNAYTLGRRQGSLFCKKNS